jgi:hypothetical protein
MMAKKILIKSDTPTTSAAKHTLYIDVDDEITGIIDRVVSSKSGIIAVVLPKHASVFQSIVNMKLLKKAATQSRKHIVLITSDQSVMPIAATVGMYVAKTPSSKPSIPVATKSKDEKSTDMSDGDIIAGTTVSVGSDGPIELDNTTSEDTADKKESKKEKSFRIPDFSSFRMKLLISGAGLISLVVLWVFGFVILPKATITVNTDTQSAPVNTQVTLQTGLTEADLDKGLIPAKRVQLEKTEEATIPATGEKNIGQKATGSMNLTNCIKSEGNQIVPAGTRFSVESIIFESVEQAVLPESTFNFLGQCRSKENGDDKTVSVVAIQAGESSNLSAQTYTSAMSSIEASGGAMTGGTTENVTVISQEDVDRAKQQSSGTSKSTAIEQLVMQLSEQNVVAVNESLTESDPKVDVSPAVGEEAAAVTVKTTINYAMLGVNEDDISAFLDKKIQDSLADQGKNIRSNGLADISYRLTNRPDASTQIFTLETIGIVGPEFNVAELKESIAGKKRGDIERILEAIDGVRSAIVEYSPAWITTTPKSSDKIEILFIEQDE